MSFSNSCAISLPSVLLVTGQADAAWNVPDGAAFVPPTFIVPPVAIARHLRGLVQVPKDRIDLRLCEAIACIWKLLSLVPRLRTRSPQ